MALPASQPSFWDLTIRVHRQGKESTPESTIVTVNGQNSFKDVIYKACDALNIGNPEIYGLCNPSAADGGTPTRKSFRDVTLWQPEHRALRLCDVKDGDIFAMRVRNHITSGPQSIKIIVAPYNQEFFYRYNFTTTVQTLLEQILTSIGPDKANIKVGHTGKWRVFLPIDSPTSGIWMDPARTLHSYDLYGSTDTWSTIAQKNQDLLRPLIICKLNEERNSVKLQDNFLKNPLESKWLQYLEQLETLKQKSPDKLKKLIREGIPETLRGHVWLRLAGAWDAMVMRPTLYARHKFEKIKEIHAESIRKDVARTYPSHPFFVEDSQGVQVLTNVLHAIAAKHQNIGYCQGMNFIAACFLLNMDEEKAFWLLDALICKYGWDGFFDPDMPSIHPSMRQFKILLDTTLPQLGKHLEKIMVTPTVYASPWFTTLFTYDAPLPFLFRMFDIFFVEGVSVIFRLALAIMQDAEAELLRCDMDGAIPLIRDIPARIYHPDIIIEMAMKIKYHKLMRKIFTEEEIDELMAQPKGFWEMFKQKVFPDRSPPNSPINTNPLSRSSNRITMKHTQSSAKIVIATKAAPVSDVAESPTVGTPTGRPRGRSRSLDGSSGTKLFIPSPVIEREINKGNSGNGIMDLPPIDDLILDASIPNVSISEASPSTASPPAIPGANISESPVSSLGTPIDQPSSTQSPSEAQADLCIIAGGQSPLSSEVTGSPTEAGQTSSVSASATCAEETSLDEADFVVL